MNEQIINEEILLKNIKTLVDRFNKIRKQDLSDYQSVLREQGVEAERVLGSSLYILPKVEKYYRKKRGDICELYQSSTDKKLSAYERESIIKSKSSQYRELRDMVQNIKQFSQNRINYIQSLLKSSDEKHKMGA